eukprot:TRINITY_DN3955_c0_g1_i2.p10 TRINITY_DN3955_c0_g1~~TRINITY_DN3955_c0_g1_i2.p10  ORF type:complete len:100 (-),score=13.37 TRINITY_DN3955_c0_g1_i2:163-462(-)
MRPPGPGGSPQPVVKSAYSLTATVGKVMKAAATAALPAVEKGGGASSLPGGGVVIRATRRAEVGAAVAGRRLQIRGRAEARTPPTGWQTPRKRPGVGPS